MPRVPARGLPRDMHARSNQRFGHPTAAPLGWRCWGAARCGRSHLWGRARAVLRRIQAVGRPQTQAALGAEGGPALHKAPYGGAGPPARRPRWGSSEISPGHGPRMLMMIGASGSKLDKQKKDVGGGSVSPGSARPARPPASTSSPQIRAGSTNVRRTPRHEGPYYAETPSGPLPEDARATPPRRAKQQLLQPMVPRQA